MTSGKSLIYHLYMGETKNPALINYVRRDDKGFKDSTLHRGKPVMAKWPDSFNVFVSGTQPLDYFMCGPEYYVVSQFAMEIIKSYAESSVEFLPVKIVSSDIKDPLGQYWIMNTLNNIDALNWEQTMWGTSEVPYGDEWASFIKPALNLAKIKNQHIFLLRVGKHIRSGIYVSEALRYNLKRNKAALGMDFMPIKVV
jgi:hypothetical protein